MTEVHSVVIITAFQDQLRQLKAHLNNLLLVKLLAYPGFRSGPNFCFLFFHLDSPL